MPFPLDPPCNFRAESAKRACVFLMQKACQKKHEIDGCVLKKSCQINSSIQIFDFPDFSPFKKVIHRLCYFNSQVINRLCTTYLIEY